MSTLIRAYKQGIITDLSSVIIKLKENGFHLPENTDELIFKIENNH